MAIQEDAAKKNIKKNFFEKEKNYRRKSLIIASPLGISVA